MEVRSWVISRVLRLEQTSSSALKLIFRMFKDESKTLGNLSSALSFKSKIDLLLDLDEIDKVEYAHLLKLMEIRNQFAHNPYATSFKEFDNINPEINKYLLKHSSITLEKGIDYEKRLRECFNDLFKKTAARLLSIEIEYKGGLELEMRKYVNDKVVENIEIIWQKTLEKNRQIKSELLNPTLIDNTDGELNILFGNLQISISEFALEELQKLEGREASVYKQKIPIKEQLEENSKKIRKQKK